MAPPLRTADLRALVTPADRAVAERGGRLAQLSPDLAQALRAWLSNSARLSLGRLRNTVEVWARLQEARLRQTGVGDQTMLEVVVPGLRPEALDLRNPFR